VANVGADPWGDELRAALTAAGVDTTRFRRLPTATTGSAFIQVTPDGTVRDRDSTAGDGTGW
jgi:ribokinase